MTRGVANLVNIFDPEAIMIGGGLSNSKELVVDGKKLCIDPSLPVLRVLSRKYSLLVMLSIKINGKGSNFNNVKVLTY